MQMLELSFRELKLTAKNMWWSLTEQKQVLENRMGNVDEETQTQKWWYTNQDQKYCVYGGIIWPKFILKFVLGDMKPVIKNWAVDFSLGLEGKNPSHAPFWDVGSWWEALALECTLQSLSHLPTVASVSPCAFFSHIMVLAMGLRAQPLPRMMSS